MRGQTIKCRYRGHEIVVRNMGHSTQLRVFVYKDKDVDPYYRSASPNLQVALMYAQNAIHYQLDGEGTWPGGLPLIAKSNLPETQARARLGLRTLWVDGRVQDYLSQKAED